MTEAVFAPAPNPDAGGPRRPRGLGVFAGGFAYWLLFLLVLEPGNLLAAIGHGGLDLGREALRIVAASVLGAMVTPVVRALVRRYPVMGARRWSSLARLAASDLVLSAVLILAGCLLARLFLYVDRRPLPVALVHELLGNGPLVGFAIAALMALVHLLDGRTPSAHDGGRLSSASPWLVRVAVKSRGRTELVDLDRVDWIETQGNYLALHGASSVWLLRETSGRFETQLDPARFVRIHRRTLVALERVRGLRSIGAGDAIVDLADGTELRVSRSYRARLAAFIEDG